MTSFCVQGQRVNTLGFTNCLGLLQLFSSATVVPKQLWTLMNEWMKKSYSKTSQTWKFEFSQNWNFSHNFHKISLLFCVIFFQLFKNIKTILSLQAIQKQMAGLIWPVGHNFPTAVLKKNSWNISWNQPEPSPLQFTWGEFSGYRNSCSLW